MGKKQNKEELLAGFNEAYASLNPAQKQAVDTIEGPVMVIAGPGTGKTQILTLRIVNILVRTDTKPENILALTFTESGVVAMRERLSRYIGSDAYRVGINTFHGFAGSLISQYPDAYERIIGSQVATEIEKINCIEAILGEKQVKILRPPGDPHYYVGHILRCISELKQEYVTPDGFSIIIDKQEKELLAIEQFHTKGAHKGKVRSEYQKKEKAIAKNRELLFVYRQYEALMRAGKLYDFNDMLIETISALQKNEDMLRDLQETYQYLLADEHQDVNGSQNKILELLSSFHEHPNVFVVGDEKQAIYRFQGASLENFLYFEDLFPGTVSIALTENYRSGQSILDIAHSLVSVDEGPLKELRVPLQAKKDILSTISLTNHSLVQYEDNSVVEEIKSLIERGESPEEIAVLLRTNKEVEEFSSLLRKSGVSVHSSVEVDVLSHPTTRAVLNLVRAMVPGDESALTQTLLCAHWGISPSDLFCLLSARNATITLSELISNRSKLEELGIRAPETILNVHRVLEGSRKRELTHSPQEVLEYLIRESDLFDLIMKESPLEGGAVLRQVYDEIELLLLRDGKTTLSVIPKVFAQYELYKIPLTVPGYLGVTHAVRVQTAHKAKGLEYTHVFIPHLLDTLWGERKNRVYFDIPQTKHLTKETLESLDESDDERRLFYVALTRAKKSVHLSFSRTSKSEKETIPSRFLEEIDTSSITVREGNEDPTSLSRSLGMETPTVPIDAELIATHLRAYGLSATSLNNYLASPWDYLFRNVLRIPEVQKESLLYGTLVHTVLEKIIKGKSAGVIISANDIKKHLDSALGKLPLSIESATRLHEQAFSELFAYLEHTLPNLPKEIRTEFSIKVEFSTGLAHFPIVSLTGKLDRLDFAPDGTLFQVCDYKTGRPKSRNEIEGKTKNGEGNYKRQIVFYALLLSLYGDERYKTRRGVISFVQPDQKGVVHEEAFEVTYEEIEELKSTLIRVVDEISRGAFLSYTCDPESSAYCHLVEALIKK